MSINCENLIINDAMKDLNESEFDEEEFDRKCDIMDNAFPNLPFCPDNHHADILDEVLLESNTAIIFHPKKCIVCCPNDIRVEIIPIIRDKYITYRDFYQECEAKWNQKMCNHRFLEVIDIKNNCQIELGFGS